jgi:hypothetical protein
LSRKNCFASSFVTSILLVLLCTQTATSQTVIPNTVQKAERVTVQGTTSRLIARSADAGRMPAGQNLGRMLLLLSPTSEQESAAAALVSSLHDASSPSYHKWLTPEEFGQQFGISEADAAQVRQWLLSQGLMVHEISQSRRFIVFSGTVAQVENAFSTEMHSYTYDAKPFISNSSDIQIPAALQSVVKGVVRLHSDPRSPLAFMGGKVHFKRSPGHFSFGDGTHYMTPADFAKIYNVQPLYDAGIDGTGQTIAIVGRSNIDLKSVTDYRAIVGLPANDPQNPQIIINGDDPGQTRFDMPEALLDVTWSGAVAPKATIKFVVSQSNFADGIDVSAAYIVDHNLAPVMSTSYGSCEQTMGPVQTAFYNSLWMQAAAQGITSFVSSGDNGGAGCDSPGGGNYASGFGVNGIASTPYNVAVGGTQFDDVANPGAYWSTTTDPVTGRSALGYIPEKVWNESSSDPNAVSLWAGSGGVSTLYAKPDWQTAFGVPNDGKRDLPDFSLSAASHDGYLVCLFDSCANGNYFYAFGGTSASSPAAAGIMALVNQKMGGQRQGVANYVFYKLASTPGVYHDTTVGDNKVPDANGQYTVGFSAGPGYDLATGLGSVDATALVNNWQAAAATLGSTTTLKLGNGQSLPVVHGTPLTFNAAVTCSGAACKNTTGQVSLMATSATGGSVAAGVGQLTPGSPTSTSNIQTGTVPGGTYNVTARYSGDATYYSSTSSPVLVNVTPEASFTYLGAIGGGSYNTTPVTITYDEPVHLGMVVLGNSGYGYPTGQLTLQADGQPASTVLGDGTTPSLLTLNYGEKSTLLSPTNATVSQSSTISWLGTGLPVGTHQLQAKYPGDNSFGSSTSNAFSVTINKATSFIADFFPVGTPVTNVPVRLAGQLALNNFCAPFGGTVTATDLTSATPVILGSGPALSLYCDSYSINVTFTTPGKADQNCPNGTACMHVVRIDYSGDSNVNPASKTFNLFPVYVNAPSNISLSADVTSANAGSAITLTANVSSDVRLHPATGAVTFLDGSATVGTATLDANGNAVLVTKTLSAGTHNITAHYPGDTALASSDSSPITETIADYTVQVFPANLTIQDGMSGTASFNIIPVGGFAQAVQLSCGTLPAHVSCTFAPSSVTLDGVNPSTVVLTVNTNSASASPRRSSGMWAVPSTLAFAALLLPFGRRKRFKAYFAAAGLIVLGLCGIGCGGSSPAPNNNPVGATPGTYSISINSTVGGATSGKSASLVVTITK